MPPRKRTGKPASKNGRTAYTEEQKTQALQLYVEHGPAEAERQTAIPRRTISSWARRTGTQPAAPGKMAEAIAASALTLEQRKQALAGRLLTEVSLLLDQLHEPVVERKIVTLPGKILLAPAEGDEGEPVLTSGWTTAEVQRVQPTFAEQKTIMVSAAIAVDKVQVLTGGATHRVAFEGEADREVQSVAAEIIQIATRRAG